MRPQLTFLFLAAIIRLAAPLIYDPEQVRWNLNQNQTATDPLDYWGEWPNHSGQSSHSNCVQDCRLTFFSIQPIACQLAFPLLHPYARQIHQRRSLKRRYQRDRLGA